MPERSIPSLVNECAPSLDGERGYDALKEWIVGSHVGTLTIRTLTDSVLGVIHLSGNAAANVFVGRAKQLGRSGCEMFSLKFYDGPLQADGQVDTAQA